MCFLMRQPPFNRLVLQYSSIPERVRVVTHEGAQLPELDHGDGLAIGPVLAWLTVGSA